LTTSNNHCSTVFTSEVVKIVTFETETWLKFRDETETDTSSKTPRPRLEVRDRDRDSKLQNLCILPKFFTKMSSSFLTVGVRRGETGISPLEIETKHQDYLENMKLVAQFRSID